MPLIGYAALGGAIGAALRYSVGMTVARLLPAFGFPLATFTVNILGGFLMGALASYLALKVDGGAALRALLGVGVLGGFTTFSAFSLELMLMIDRQQWAAAGFYATSSVLLSVLALFAGAGFLRAIL